MSNYKGPFIGIAGIISQKQIKTIVAKINPDTILGAYIEYRCVMAGILVNSETLAGKIIKDKRKNRFPDVNQLSEIFLNHPKILNVVNFYTMDQENLLKDMLEIAKLGGENLNGLQLNITWPDTKTIREYKKKFPNHIIILEFDRDILRENSPDSLANKIFGKYEGLVDYIVLGLGEEGISLYVNETAKYLRAIQKKTEIGLAVTGNIGPGNLLDEITILLKSKGFKDLSFSADFGLLNSEGGLDMKKMAQYLRGANQSTTSYHRVKIS
ncbi:hypothetical protein A3I25_00305 [Candidatus Nomurabacteria bacterium RIFCSPLOWO2_02_FULL_42_17]|uniref:Phosphoribosylanthranilate isomerase n=1 Tax=Candidatus Nomurabacteria bacterium RIFCSPLOWO2_02_FULL_42_17 TaxID=1801789 RepID=A0A1F6XU81_9BACT|nr:MAG: hypothetical protein UV08_C0014G0014 [Parcubacteria group bacterium GW2011_GWA2_42_18]OGI97689.1 MAG: hypothetical protein A3I25_00305 [Candidatus Nomurabacteria bacterium RIFCSPLOWO2_02_FULL_42_17]